MYVYRYILVSLSVYVLQTLSLSLLVCSMIETSKQYLSRRLLTGVSMIAPKIHTNEYSEGASALFHTHQNPTTKPTPIARMT